VTTIQLAELGPDAAEKLRNGETVEVLDGNTPVAKVVPVAERGSSRSEPLPEWFFTERPPKFEEGSVLEQLLEDRRSTLVRAGKVRPGTGTLPPDFLTRPLPRAEQSVLEQLIDDRRNGR
jgi:antitoxin (DNA-binding transcriptional repressor) of toxin-antitoxin stability system